MIITGGRNVSPREVEIFVKGIDGMATCAVFGVPHPDFGEAVAAVVEIEPGGVFNDAALSAAARPRRAAYKAPKRIVAVQAVPTNRMVKVLKGTLRTEYAHLFRPATAGAA